MPGNGGLAAGWYVVEKMVVLLTEKCSVRYNKRAGLSL